jgi:signal transduction histidine kinase
MAWQCWFPIALALVITATALMHLTHQQQVALAQQLVHTLAAEVDTGLARHIQGLQALAAGTASQSPTTPLSRLHAEAVSYQQSIGVPVTLADADRQILLSSARPFGRPLPMLPNAPGPSALDRALQTGEPQVSDLVEGTVSGAPVIAVVVPAPWAPDTKAWISSLSTDLLQHRLDQAVVPPGWNAVLLDGNGKLLAARGPNVDTAALHSDGSVSIAVPVSHTRWTALMYASVWTLYQPQLRMGVLLVVLLSITSLSTVWLVRKNSQRINMAVVRLTDSGDERSVSTRIDVFRLRIAEIEEVHQELRRLRLAEHIVQEQERTRVARDLHDGLQQHMASAKIMANLATQRSDLPPECAYFLHRVVKITEEATNELHRIVNDLRPHVLDQCGLIEAVEQLSEETSRATGLLIEVESVGDSSTLSSLPAPLLGCAFRVIQECLNNVRKHARATFVHVVIDLTGSGLLSVQVSDDGIGFFDAWPVRSSTSFGLISMRQRVTALGGTISVSRGQPDDHASGTTVIATIPIQSQST